MSFIYVLTEPNDGCIRYVGVTTEPEVRLQRHCQPSYLRGTTHKERWINKLLRQGQKPEMLILGEYPSAKEAFEAEIALIKTFKELGCRLTNTTMGGEAVNIPGKRSRAWVEKIAAANRGKVRSTETRAKIAASSNNASGEHSPKAKLTNGQAAEIRQRHTQGESYSKIALAFGVTKQTIANVVKRRCYNGI
jgi:predicted GIY-YIG superfamily endonuclease